MPGSLLPSTQAIHCGFNRLLQEGFSTKETLNSSTEAKIHNLSKGYLGMCAEFQVKKPKLKIWGGDHVLTPPSFQFLSPKWMMFQPSKWTHPLGVSDQDTRALTGQYPSFSECFFWLVF